MIAKLLVFSLAMTSVLLIASALMAGYPSGHPDVSQPNDSCQSCHPAAQVTADDAPAQAAPQPNGRVLATNHTDRGPDVIQIDRMARFYSPVPFAHKIHADMSEMNGGCANCHHYNQQSDTPAACVECHPPAAGAGTLAQPGLKGAYHRQCLNCHRDWAHSNACEYCHTERLNPAAPEVMAVPAELVSTPHPRIAATPSFTYRTTHEPGPVVTFHHVDHAESFGLRCVDCHQNDTCGDCHDADAKPMEVKHVTSCCNCHEEKNCTFCHDQAERPAFDHAALAGWKLEAYHAEAACADCHGPAKAFRTPSTGSRSCHRHLKAGRFDHAVTGVPLIGSHAHFDCQRCHPDGNPAAAPTCGGCHPDISYPQHLPGRRSAD